MRNTKKLLCLLVACWSAWSAAVAVEYLEPSAVKTDVIQTNNAKRPHVEGALVRESFIISIIKSEKGDEVKVPQAVIVTVYYRGADNDAYINGLNNLEIKNYGEALSNFETAERSAKNVPDALRPFFLERVNFYKGVCLFNLGEYDNADKAFLAAVKRDDAIHKFEGEYWLARSLEARGEYEKALAKYNALATVIYPKLAEAKPMGADKWTYLANLGKERAQLLALTNKPDQEDKVKGALAQFETTFKKGGEFLTAELKMGGVQMNSAGLKYLAQKTPENYDKLIKQLEEPLRDAAAEDDKSNLAWMYLDRADAYFGLMEKAEKEKKKEYAEAALFDYMRAAYGYKIPPADTARAWYRLGVLLEFLQGDDWQQRALTHYRRATAGTYKSTPSYDPAMKARKTLEDAVAAAAKK